MLFCKLIGGVLIVFCGYTCGRVISQRGERKLKQTEAFLALIIHVRNMIDRYLMPIDRIFRECDEKLLSDCGACGEFESFGALLESAELFLDAEICDGLRNFSEELGRGWRESQIRLCDEQILRLTRERERLSTDLPRSRRASVTLAVCISAGIAILFM